MRTLEDIYKSVYKENIPEDAYTQIVSLSLKSYPFFVEHVLNMNQPLRLGDFHKEDLGKIHHRFILVEWPRGHLKTTLWTVGYIVWRMWKEVNKNIGITSAAATQSMEKLEFIQDAISNNEFLVHLIPESRNDTWNKYQLNTTNGNRCKALTYNDTSRGNHLDYLVLDDILMDQNMTHTQIKDTFWNIFFPMVSTRRGQILMVGTPLATRDLFAEIKEKSAKSGWKIIHREAVIMDDNANWKEPLWPERFTLTELEQIRYQQSSMKFYREYMCRPRASGTSVFNIKKIGDHPEHMRGRDGYSYFIGIDVSMSGSKNADFLVFSIIAKDKDGNLKHVKQERWQGRDENFILKRTLELAESFHPKRICVEQIGISIGVVNMMLDPSKFPLLAPRIEPYKMNRWHQKEELISVLQSALETGTLEVLDNPILIDELDSFQIKETDDGKVTFEGSGSHDDCVMALALANWVALSKTGVVSFSFVGPASDKELEEWLKEEESKEIDEDEYAVLI